jgi:hypothetical protein
MTANLRGVTATRYVTPLREGGSLPGLVEADDDGLYVLKFRGAGQGVRALIAEVLAGELARQLGLPVPELVLVEVDPAMGRAEPDPEIKELIDRSPGTNLGVDFLPGALPFDPWLSPDPGPELAAAIVWFDALVTNVDRSPRNANLLVWHRRLWCIDHGAALYFHHTWRNPAEHARRPFEQVRDHVLLPFAGSIEEADDRLAPLVDDKQLARVAGMLPDDWLTAAPATDQAGRGLDADESRAAYAAYLRGRLDAPRDWVAAAERARIEEARRDRVA